MGPVSEFFIDDHVGLNALVRRAVAVPGRLDPAAYGVFRSAICLSRRGFSRRVGLDRGEAIPELASVGHPKPTTGTLQDELQVCVESGGTMACMSAPVVYDGCNSCQNQPPTGGAAGHIAVP